MMVFPLLKGNKDDVKSVDDKMIIDQQFETRRVWFCFLLTYFHTDHDYINIKKTEFWHLLSVVANLLSHSLLEKLAHLPIKIAFDCTSKRVNFGVKWHFICSIFFPRWDLLCMVVVVVISMIIKNNNFTM